jgi:formate hydrogenlyase subunit 6/NADH:ubiquinone oxidoreductase subunit I
MKIGTMLRDVMRSFTEKPITQKYPFERLEAPERLRGQLFWDSEHCSGCGLCVKDCPADALEVITIDRATKRFVMVYELDKCTYCAQCVVNCRFKCLSMSNKDWEMAALSRDAFKKIYGDEANVDAYLEQLSHPKVEPAGAE